ncbi:MAG: hypothetical protein ACKV2U_21645 [Bryobacteraceae bacterium]
MKRKKATERRAPQADLMRALYLLHNGDRDLYVRDWAAAGERGEITRRSNLANQSWLKYGRFKFEEGTRTGWMFKDSHGDV